MRLKATVALLVLTSSSVARAQSPLKIVDKGSDQQHFVIVAMGDGYTAAELGKFHTDLDRMLAALTASEVYRDHPDAFNVYRVDAVSKESGVSTNSKHKDTALGTVYTGSGCFIAEGTQTAVKVVKLIHQVPKVDFGLILLNEQQYGGCAMDARLYMTTGSPARIIAHEYAHGIGTLYDEYSLGNGAYAGSINDGNCSTVVDGQKVAWADLISPGTQLPTDDTDRAAIGMFAGCNYYDDGIYRPAHRCLMRSLADGFCPVCARIVDARLGQTAAKPAPPLAALTRSVELTLKIAKDGSFSVLDAQESTKAPPTSPPSTSEFFYEVKSNGQSVAVAALPPSLFQQRGYGPTGADGGVPHGRSETSTAIVTVRLPNTTLEQMSNQRLDISLYRFVKQQAENFVLSSASVQELRAGKIIEQQFVLTNDKLKAAMTTYRNRQIR
jgi:hypothetical protein